MHVQNHERVQNFCFYPFRKKLKENPATRHFKGQARSVTADSAASRDCVVRFALAKRAQTWFPRENKDKHIIFEILR